MQFLYEDPFIFSKDNKYEYILEVLSESEKQDEQKIRDIIFEFAEIEDLIIDREGELFINPGQDTGSWKWLITTTNFRSMVVESKYNQFIHALVMGNNNPIDKIIDLHFRLGTLFDHKILNTIINRLYNSIKLIPYKEEENESLQTWDYIHIDSPFMWICIFIQVILRTAVGKNIGD